MKGWILAAGMALAAVTIIFALGAHTPKDKMNGPAAIEGPR